MNSHWYLEELRRYGKIQPSQIDFAHTTRQAARVKLKLARSWKARLHLADRFARLITETEPPCT